MTTIEFQPEFSHLRLDRADVDRLVGWTADPDFPLPGQHPGIASELQAAGAIDPAGELAAPLALALAAVADPICRLTLQLRDGQGRVEQAESWVSGDAAALLLPLPGERYEFGVTHPTFLPAMLARVVGLGPRPRLDATMPVPVSADQLDQFTDPDPTRRAAARAGVPAVAEVHRYWRIQVSWRPAEGSTGVRVLRVLDTAAGVWAVELHGSRVMLFPSAPTAVWRALTGLLPTDRELGVEVRSR